MATVTIWHGSRSDFRKLEQAIGHNCDCPEDVTSNRRCPAHKMLLEQRTLDHLAFVHDDVDRYVLAEFDG